jgi:Flp pilus assembly protein TadD
VADTLAMVLFEQGVYLRALEINEQASRLAPNDPRFPLHRVEILARYGAVDTARALLDELAVRELGPPERAGVDRLRQQLGR